MVRVLAQKMTGTCRMCASCSAVTKTGYLVRRGGAELFVCQSCFTAQFGSDYQLVRSFEPEPVRPRPRPVARRQVEPRPHPAVRPRQVEPRPVLACPETGRDRVLRELAALVNQGVEVLRVGLIAGLLLLVVMFGVDEQGGAAGSPAAGPRAEHFYKREVIMIQSVMNSGFKALSGWLLLFSAVVLLFFIVASVVNAISGTSRFNTGEIMKLLTTTLGFTALYAVLDYFFV